MRNSPERFLFTKEIRRLVIPDWLTNTVVISDRLPQTFPPLVREFERILSAADIPLHTVAGTRDYWIRDYAPIQVGPDQFVQFRYEPDYLWDGYRALITPPEVCAASPMFADARSSPVVLDGGNVVGTQRIAILTEKVRRENRRLQWDRLRETLIATLQVQEIITIPVEPDDETGHADGMVRFLSEATVVVNDYRYGNGGFARSVEHLLQMAGLDVVCMPYVPDTGRRKRGDISSAVGNYVNFLRVGSVVVVPAYGLVEDQLAERLLRDWLPDCQIHSLPCCELAKKGGVLNCVTATLRRVEGAGKVS